MTTLVRGLGRRFDRLRADWRDHGLSEIRAGLYAPGERGDILEIDGRRVLRGVLTLASVSVLFPELGPAIDEVALLPRLDVALVDDGGEPVSGSVWRVPLDPVTGQPQRERKLGPLPLRGVRIDPGFCRVVVKRTNGGWHEFTRWITLATARYQIEETVRPQQSSTEGMTLIAEREFRLSDAGGSPTALAGRVVRIDPFWIDNCEVSNGEYREFLVATGHRRPPFWNLITAGSVEDRLPVTMVSWGDARTYAEWRGKRLPSYAEWYLAARGPEGWRVPWVADSEDFRGNTRHLRLPRAGAAVAFRRYLERAAPVDSHPDARTPTGLYHMLGNVAEWCESMFAARRGGAFESLPGQRIVVGNWWCAQVAPDDLASFAFGAASPEFLVPYNGFRCVRSQSR